MLCNKMLGFSVFFLLGMRFTLKNNNSIWATWMTVLDLSCSYQISDSEDVAVQNHKRLRSGKGSYRQLVIKEFLFVKLLNNRNRIKFCYIR